jgi:hypothetical protein
MMISNSRTPNYPGHYPSHRTSHYPGHKSCKYLRKPHIKTGFD